jgi:hypothetical protein
MGNCGGVTEGPHSKYWNKFRLDFEALGLCEKDIKAMHFIFRYIETSGVNPDGNIPASSVLEYMPDRLSQHLFMNKMFGIYTTKNKDDRLNFRQFVHTLYNFCSLTHICLVRFAFDLYNPLGKARLSLSEVKKLIQELHGPIGDKEEGKYM